MNKQIKLLAEKSGFQFDSLGGTYTGGTLTNNLEKFAELIVLECLTLSDNFRDSCDEDDEPQQALGAEWVGLAIARHFGVE